MEITPPRLFICPRCKYNTRYRWVLSQHLLKVHRLDIEEANRIAEINEYFANPVRYMKIDNK